MLLEGDSAAGSWSSCPTEVLQQIVVQIDDPSDLLRLGQVDRLMNQVALQHLLQRTGVQGVERGWIFAHARGSLRKEVVHALCMSLWINDDIHDMRFYVSPTVQQIFREIRGLTRFIGRLKRLGGLVVVFRGLDHRFGRRTLTPIPTDAWQTAFCCFIDTILSKGCESIEVEGADFFHYHFEVDGDQYFPFYTPLSRSDALPQTRERKRGEKNERRQPDSHRSLISRISTTLQRLMKRKDGYEKMDDWVPILPNNIEDQAFIEEEVRKAACLKRFLIRSSMLLVPLFLPFTLQTLRIHALAIRELELTGIRISEEPYIQKLVKLDFPALQKFSYRHHEESRGTQLSPLASACIFEFLVRHSSIESLELYPFHHESIPPNITSPLLPRLRTLVAHPREAVWVICCPDWHGNLEAVTLATINVRDRIFQIASDDTRNDYEYFDEAISAVADTSRPVTLNLELRSDQGLASWITGQVNLGETSPIRQLKHISSLSVSLRLVRQTSSISQLWSYLPRWFGLFPALRHLKLSEAPYGRNDAMNQKLYRCIVDACPLLETLRVFLDLVFPESGVDPRL
ncbi:hypothetical protein NP233_g12591 [Leucocoprinus birnbaumii]|uniref:F-box domain-containing protein n=1 Tax=Leucocoprinus birnbaumii TaxID=56174 RepID=A0AAD5VIB4_9AGAR|nr:hypothetical protein NP233_g12591 [Leucocoprinus birnbaumii]